MLVPWLLLVAQAAPAPRAPSAPQAVPAATPTEPAEQAPEVAPYAGPLEQGLEELARASVEGEHAQAMELAAALVAASEQDPLAEARRARLLHDVGLARGRAGQVGQASADLRAAAGLAGPGALRATCLFDAGALVLERAEQLRLQVPEIARRLELPSPPVPPASSAQGEAPDPLELARAGYLAARAELLERLRLDWSHEDTRANLELIARRLRELDEVEQQREQQQQQQQQQPDQEQQPDQQQQDTQQDPQQDPQDPQAGEEQQGEQEQGEQQPEQEQPEPGPDEEPSGEAQPESAREDERVLSREEVQRLLDQLQEIEEQARAVRAMLRERRRTPVEKDW